MDTAATAPAPTAHLGCATNDAATYDNPNDGHTNDGNVHTTHATTTSVRHDRNAKSSYKQYALWKNDVKWRGSKKLE